MLLKVKSFEQTYNFQRGKCEAEQQAVTECAARVVRALVEFHSNIVFIFSPQATTEKKRDTMRYHLVRLLKAVRR